MHARTLGSCVGRLQALRRRSSALPCRGSIPNGASQVRTPPRQGDTACKARTRLSGSLVSPLRARTALRTRPVEPGTVRRSSLLSRARGGTINRCGRWCWTWLLYSRLRRYACSLDRSSQSSGSFTARCAAQGLSQTAGLYSGSFENCPSAARSAFRTRGLLVALKRYRGRRSYHRCTSQ